MFDERNIDNPEEWDMVLRKQNKICRLRNVVHLPLLVLICIQIPASSSWGKTWARDDHVIPIHYPDWPCSQHGCSDSVVVITPNR